MASHDPRDRTDDETPDNKDDVERRENSEDATPEKLEPVRGHAALGDQVSADREEPQDSHPADVLLIVGQTKEWIFAPSPKRKRVRKNHGGGKQQPKEAKRVLVTSEPCRNGPAPIEPIRARLGNRLRLGTRVNAHVGPAAFFTWNYIPHRTTS